MSVILYFVFFAFFAVKSLFLLSLLFGCGFAALGPSLCVLRRAAQNVVNQRLWSGGRLALGIDENP